MNSSAIKLRKNPQYLADAIWINFGSSKDSRVGYDGANNEWTVLTKDAGGTQTDRARVKANQDVTRFELYNDDPGATGVQLDVHHDSASPAASDVLLHLRVYGEDSASAKTQYAGIKVNVDDPVNGSEDATTVIETMTAGTLREVAVPNVTANDTFVVLALAQAISGVKTHSANIILNDNVTLGLGTSSGEGTISSDGTSIKIGSVAGKDIILGDDNEVMRVSGGDVVIFGSGEGGTTAATGKTIRGPDITTGGAGNVAGADLTIAAGLGTGIGDVGTIILSLPIVATAGDNIQTTATRLTFDMVASTTVLTVKMAQNVQWSGNTLVIDTVDIDGGAIDGAAIGAASATTIVGTTIDATTDFTIGATIITDGVLTDAGGFQIDANLDLNSNTLSNIGASGNDWTANVLRHSSSLDGILEMHLNNTRNVDDNDKARLEISVGGTSAGDPFLQFDRAGSAPWGVGMDNSNVDAFVISNGNALGVNDALRITDATPPVVTYNTTHPTGTFDYVCPVCGHHSEGPFACHGQPAKWQDDVMVFRSMALRQESGIDQMVKVGVMERTRDNDGNPEVFTKLGPDWLFVGAMAYQNRVRMDSLHLEHTRHFGMVEDRMDELASAQSGTQDQIEAVVEAQEILRAQVVALGETPEA